MSRKRYTAEEIINKLHEADVLQSQGKTITEVARQLEISEMTYYKWRKEYGRTESGSGKAIEGAGTRNSRLRKVVADLTIDNSILKEAARGSFSSPAKKRRAVEEVQENIGY